VAENLNVQVTGKSKYEVAHEMAIQILVSVEGKNWSTIKREDYLKAHYDALVVLDGNAP
jgi:hypothetical protein